MLTQRFVIFRARLRAARLSTYNDRHFFDELMIRSYSLGFVELFIHTDSNVVGLYLWKHPHYYLTTLRALGGAHNIVVSII